MTGLKDIDYVLAKLDFLREERIWPNGLLYEELKEQHYLDEAVWLVGDVERVLGRKRGIRIGEEPDRDGQYFHYLAMWIFALDRLGAVDRRYREKAIALVRDIHPAFVVPGRGVHWKMREDLSGPYPGLGFGALDAFHGLVVYRLLDPAGLAPQIADMRSLVEASYRSLTITQDLGLGMMLWMTHFFPDEAWAVIQRTRALTVLDDMWVD